MENAMSAATVIAAATLAAPAASHANGGDRRYRGYRQLSSPMPELTPLMQIAVVGDTIDSSPVKAQLKLESGNNEGHSVGGLDILSAIR